LPSDARYLLTEKRDGRFVLLLWRDVSVWDPVNRQRQAVTPADVTVRLEQPRRLQAYRPTEGAEAVAAATGTSLPLRLDGQVTAVTIDPARPPQPRDVAVQPADGSATVTWRLPTTSAEVTGFEVTREPGGLSAQVGPSARSYVDGALTNGTRYRYSVRTLGADGASAYAEAPAVVPAGLPGRPRILSATAGRRSVTVAWQPSDANGSRVTAYRLVCAGRTITVGPGKRSATISGLPAQRRVRVLVRAQNAVGWGPVTRSAYVTTLGT
ncbi:MAG TPA: fibronectin type III domain-containing protein, partial [Nocardioides sp.]|nr:fibronectin type III domain-containing protein [Nocardioides sp.]